MFRKVSKRSRPSQRRREEETDPNKQDNDDDDEEREEEEESISNRIQQTQKKHKLLASLPIATADASGKKKLRYFSTTTSTSQNAVDSTAQLTVLEQKHQQAMEEFLRGNLRETGGPDEEETTKTATAEDPKVALYQELAASTVKSQVLNPSGNVDDDKGAMLVGGTGLAEVILPKRVSTREGTSQTGIRYSRNPQGSSAMAGGFRSQRYSTPGGSHSAADAATATSTSTLPPAGFRSMVPQQPQQPQEPHQQPRSNEASTMDETKDDPSLILAQQETTSDDATPGPSSVDDSRPGFAALRHSSSTRPTTTTTTNTISDNHNNHNHNKPRGQQNQRDQDAFRKFVKRQRESGGKW